MSVKTIPAPKYVKDTLTGIADKPIEIANGRPIAVTSDSDTYVGIYTNDHLKIGAIMVLDLPLAGWLSAALCVMPPGGVQEAVERRILPATVVEAIPEVFNMSAGIFNYPGGQHLKVYQTVEPGTQPPLDVLALANSLGRRLDLHITVPGYGEGNLSIVLAP
jgi:hypothetical protein